MRQKPDNTKTQDGTQSQTWEDWQKEFPEEQIKPRLRLLYHVDIARIGAVSHPDTTLSDEEGQIIGRKDPLFVEPGAEGMERALEDATISREQLVIRWLAAQQVFEVEPLPEAKRKLLLLDLASNVSTEITKKTLASPGQCIAIEDRVLLGLELSQRHHEAEESRLGFVGESEEMWRLREDISEVASFKKPALILGQTGAGKELVAHAIHKQSPRASGPFLTVNCAALPEHLVESILFGHKKGAFTGADSAQEGMFRAADGGTLFLDELGEMPLLVQPKLLRTLQDGQVSAVGNHKTTAVDVRLIAATNRDPKAEIIAGRLREDLYHRLAGHVLQVPHLSARRFDIPQLFIYFLQRVKQEHPESAWLFEGANGWRRMIPMGFFIELMRGSWTGNVRELENVAERTIRKNLSAGPFRAPELPGQVMAQPIVEPPSAERMPVVISPPETLRSVRPQEAAKYIAPASQLLGLAHKTIAKLFTDEALAQLFIQGDEATLARVERAAKDRLFEILIEHDFKQRNVAATLEMSPSTLIKLMQRFGLPRPTDLSLEVIEEALQQVGGDVEAAAQALNVSPQGLKKFLSTAKR